MVHVVSEDYFGDKGWLSYQRSKELIGIVAFWVFNYFMNWFLYCLSALCIGCVCWIAYVSRLRIDRCVLTYGMVKTRNCILYITSHQEHGKPLS
jgi:hypothetical protein